MATTSSNPAAAFSEAARYGEIRSRVFFLIGALVVYRIGTFIPVPGINPAEVARFFGDRSNTILGVVNMFSGGALSRLSIFAMGVMPYISASIIIQMMSMVVPTLMELRKEGESGRRKITQYTRYGTVLLAVVQSFAAAGALDKGGMTLITGWPFLITATITMTTGTMFLMWLGEQITERGIGNGISMIILSGIVAGLPGAVGNTFDAVSSGEMQGPFALLLIIVVLATTYFVVFVERAQRRIPVDYAKRQGGRRMYAGQSSHLPFKLNMSGVIPPIFASSLLLFPATLARFAVKLTQDGSDPPHLRLEPPVVSGHARQLRRHRFGGLVCHRRAEHRRRPRLRSAAAPDAVRALDHLLLLLLHGSGVQCARHRREPQEVRRIRARHPPGPADRRLHRPGSHAPDTVGRAVRDRGVPDPGNPDFLAGRAVSLRRHLAAHRGGGGDGFHVAAERAHDVASLPGTSQEGEPARLWPQRFGWLRYESTSVGQEDLQELQDRAPPSRGLRHLHGPAPQAASGLR